MLKMSKNIKFDIVFSEIETNYSSDSDDEPQDNNNNLKWKSLPWTEKYRPNNLDNLLSDNYIIPTLKNFIEEKSLPHILFHGPPGTGKTSTIIACAKELYGEYLPYMVLELNTSDHRGIDTVRQRIKQFVSSVSINENSNNKYKLVILDEIDAMTSDAQSILKQIIEKNSKNARFCLICNFINKIDLALQSRCRKFRFSPHSQENIYQMLSNICSKENITINKNGINAIIKVSNGDMRKSINTLQSTFMTYGKITESNVYKCLGHCKNKDMENIYQLLKDCNNMHNTIIEITKIMRSENIFINNIINELTLKIIKDDYSDNKKNFLIDRLSAIQYKSSTSVYYDIQLSEIAAIFVISKYCKNIENLNIIDCI
jgi:DNA polymerase III delta prime subunit